MMEFVIINRNVVADVFMSFEQIVTFFNKRKNIGIKPGLERIHRLLDLVGNPQNKIKAIHVAGTNGKGSTISYIKNALMYNGYKVGVYLSPSLDGITGHIFLNDDQITEQEFLRLFNIIYPNIQEMDGSGDCPTEYEILTALAYLYFADHVDIAIIETAMGGRYDTTNCLHPILSIITNVDKDHTNFLGQTIAEIAYHKAGIIKQHTPVIVGDIHDQVFTVIEEEAQMKQAKIFRLGEQFNYELIGDENHKQRFTWFGHDVDPIHIVIQMYGVHQVKNATVAMMALRYLIHNGYMIDMKKAILGIENTFVPGRFEVLQKSPMIIVDGAHNIAGMRSFLHTVTHHFQDLNKHLIFAGFKDKDLEKMLQLLEGHFSTITVTSFEHPRAASAEYLYELIHKKQVCKIDDWKKAIAKLDEDATNRNNVYFITGSLHFIAMVRGFLLE